MRRSLSAPVSGSEGLGTSQSLLGFCCPVSTLTLPQKEHK